MRKVTVREAIAIVIAAAIIFSGRFACAQVPPVPQIPPDLPEATRGRLESECRRLAGELSALQAEAAFFNSKCRNVETGSALAQQCSAGQAKLLKQRQDYIDAVRRLKAQIAQQVVTSTCRKRAHLVSQWKSDVDRLDLDQQVVEKLLQNFKEHAAGLDLEGKRLAEEQYYLRRIDEGLGRLSNHRTTIDETREALERDVSEDIPEMPFEQYKIIANGVLAWTGNIMKIVAGAKISGETEAEVAGLKDLRSREKKLVDDVDILQRMKRNLVAAPACDTSRLVE